MAVKTCINGHTFNKTSDCPVCPTCSAVEIETLFPKDFPNIGAPAKRALHRIGIKGLEDLPKYTQKELLSLHGFGPKAIEILTAALKKEQLSFKP